MKFVIGFFKDNPEGMTEIENVSEVTGLTIDEIEDSMEVLDAPVYEEDVKEYLSNFE